MVDERVMILFEIKACNDNIEFYKKEIQRMESKVKALEEQVRGRGLRIKRE